MPRQARTKSISNIYHVMLRGINRQDIFEDDGDRLYFMKALRKCKEVSGFKLYAFCLMSNHVHLLIEPAGESLDIVFKRIGSSYAGWFNRKYQRVGHLFQDRFRSENVETDQYFMTVLRYILQNPAKAGMEKQPGTYRWSSYRAYEKGGSPSVTDTQFAENLFGSREALIAFVLQSNEDDVMDEKSHEWRIRDEQAKEIMKQVTGCSTASEFQKKEIGERKACARELYLEKLTMGQIARLTGMPKSTVQNAVNEIDPQLLMKRKEIRLRESDQTVFWTAEDEIW